jgi:type IV secretory pathway VirB9-like protein
VLIFPLGTNTSITVPGAQVTIPRDPGMVTNLVISTTKGHQYVFNPVTLSGTFTQAVEFYYPDEVRAQAAARDMAIKAGQQSQ